MFLPLTAVVVHQSAADQAVLQNIISLVKDAESQEPIKQQHLSISKQQFSTAASTDQDRLLRRPM
jgi:hypothetical protein